MIASKPVEWFFFYIGGITFVRPPIQVELIKYIVPLEGGVLAK